MRQYSWGQFSKSFFDKIIEWFRFTNIISNIPYSKQLLDIGCGYDGKLLKILRNKQLIAQGVGIDLSVSAKKYKYIKLIPTNTENNLPFTSNNFDTVVSLALIEHLHNPTKVIKDMHRVLKPDGILLITTPNAKWRGLLEFLASVGLISKNEIDDHKTYFSTRSMFNCLKSNGFDSKKIAITTYPFRKLFDFVILAKAIK